MPGRVKPFPMDRRHTLHFLESARPYAPVLLNMEVDMTQAQAVREHGLQAYGRRLSYVTLLTRVIAEAMTGFPETNAALQTFPSARLCEYEHIIAKVLVDKRWNGRRFALPCLIPNAETASPAAIQARIDELQQTDLEELADFRRVRMLNRLPIWLGRWVYRLGTWSFGGRERLQGTFTISSLGHRGINSFFPISTSTLCFGVGAVEPKPVCLGKAIVVRPMMTLSLVFDHRVIDGAMAADLMSEIRSRLESAELGRKLGVIDEAFSCAESV